MVLTAALAFGAMVTLQPLLALALLPLVAVFALTRHHFRGVLSSRADNSQILLQQWSAFLQEHLASLLSVQWLGQIKRQEHHASHLLAEITRARLNLLRSSIALMMFAALAVTFATSAVIGYGGWRVLAGSMTVGSLVAFYSYVSQLFDPLNGATDIYIRSQKALASVRQIRSVLALMPMILESSDTIPLPSEDCTLRFTAVEFGYQNRATVLHIPSLCLRAGESVAIVGENGAGKSTFARLLMRAYDTRTGSIAIGGADLRRLRLGDLHKAVAYVPRDPILFHGTFASNLRFVRTSACEEELWKILYETELSVLVEGLPGGLNTPIGPGGSQLSGGQRQRLAIARVFLQSPRIVILDEATSCLDIESEARILGNLKARLPWATLVFISHRALPHRLFDRTLELKKGRIFRDVHATQFIPADMSTSG
jgi:ABC-type multidrug transport system fused ATPase/permease subunit